MFAVEKVLFSLPAWMDINYCVDDVFCAFCLSSSTSLGSPLGRETNCIKFVRVGLFLWQTLLRLGNGLGSI